jgi:hypothetical protein
MPMHIPGHIRFPVAVLALLASGSCGHYSAPNFCFEIDGPCPGQGNGGYTTRLYVLGFPTDRVDHTTTLPTGSYRGIIHVGDSFPLQLMLAVGDTTAGSGLPVQSTRWALPDSSAAHIEATANGSAILTAIAPGIVTGFVVDGQPYNAVLSCDAQKQCFRVTEIDVLP